MTIKGYLAILLISLAVLIYIGLMVYIGVTWLPQHWLAELIFYPIAGLAWVIPLRLTIFRKPKPPTPDDQGE
ncbi:DUF2842 domain-containing protein [Rhodovibrionaceae bacterium A322]